MWLPFNPNRKLVPGTTLAYNSESLGIRITCKVLGYAEANTRIRVVITYPKIHSGTRFEPAIKGYLDDPRTTNTFVECPLCPKEEL